jgi:hypothetical protein
LTAACDLVRFRVDEPEAERGSIPLLQGVSLVGAAKNALLSAACSVVQPQRLLMDSLGRISKAIDADATESLFVHDPAQPVISANLCEAILAMEPVGERSRLSVETSWSRAYAPPPESATPSRVSLRNDVFREIEIVARQLRPSNEPKIAQFIGLVDSLLGDPDAERRVSGDVILMLFDSEGTIKARATLGPDDYKVAWRAHGEARFVSLSGMLVGERRSYRVERIAHLRLLET